MFDLTKVYDLETMSENDIKALAYDHHAQIEHSHSECKRVNDELKRRWQEDEAGRQKAIEDSQGKIIIPANLSPKIETPLNGKVKKK